MTRDQELQFIKDAVRHAMKASKIQRQKELPTNKSQVVWVPRPHMRLSGGATADVIAKVVANVKPSPPGSISRAVKAVTQNTNKLGVTSTDGRTIRNDRSTSPEFTDAATTLRRQPVAIDVQEATGQLTSRKSRRDPTAEEIRAETTFPARDADSVAAIMRANRKLM